MPRRRCVHVAVILFLALSACRTSRTYIPGIREVRGLNFTKYAEQGFLFTPEKYEGRYDALGIIEVRVFPEARRLISGTRQLVKGDSIELETVYSNDWKIEVVNSYTALDDLYEEAVAMGADAIMNFDIQWADHPLRNRSLTAHEPDNSELRGVIAEGMAIRRK